MDAIPLDVLRKILRLVVDGNEDSDLVALVCVCRRWTRDALMKEDARIRKRIAFALGRQRPTRTFLGVWVGSADAVNGFELSESQQCLIRGEEEGTRMHVAPWTGVGFTPVVEEFAWSIDFVSEHIVDGSFVRVNVWTASFLSEDALRNLCRAYMLLYYPSSRFSLDLALDGLRRLQRAFDCHVLKAAILVGLVGPGKLETTLEEAQQAAHELCGAKAVWCSDGTINDAFAEIIRDAKREEAASKKRPTSKKGCAIM